MRTRTNYHQFFNLTIFKVVKKSSDLNVFKGQNVLFHVMSKREKKNLASLGICKQIIILV